MNELKVDLPEIPIILITSTRTAYAIDTIEAIQRNLKYDGRLSWYIAADNSNDHHVAQVVRAATDGMAFKRAGHGVFTVLQETTGGYGVAANEAWRECSETGCPITFWLEDDWRLERPLDITKSVRLLLERENVGCVRYSYLPTGLECESVGHDFTMYLNIKKTRSYAFSGNPHLKHERFKYYGEYPEGKNPGDTEIFYDGKIRLRHNGPEIWWVLDIGDNPPFKHIGEEQSY